MVNARDLGTTKALNDLSLPCINLYSVLSFMVIYCVHPSLPRFSVFYVVLSKMFTEIVSVELVFSVLTTGYKSSKSAHPNYCPFDSYSWSFNFITISLDKQSTSMFLVSHVLDVYFILGKFYRPDIFHFFLLGFF